MTIQFFIVQLITRWFWMTRHFSRLLCLFTIYAYYHNYYYFYFYYFSDACDEGHIGASRLLFINITYTSLGVISQSLVTEGSFGDGILSVTLGHSSFGALERLSPSLTLVSRCIIIVDCISFLDCCLLA